MNAHVYLFTLCASIYLHLVHLHTGLPFSLPTESLTCPEKTCQLQMRLVTNLHAR
ncbi:hypothetical protein CAPTEDRAFT_110254 [Capitella teleta]|uniref:Uncharacterized protein n=1 Tax=Capitella teleta TaxID=283909 RepID=R7V0A2_CAPTE|nr:hypothetical protein CAPTEDRAFT_110254 [Capitella teleta]|eukprot:ELU09627.1 hypothetical protein CAPTEDRAFT_110254 [Capitella teleta]